MTNRQDSHLNLGLVPPQAIEFEETILGAILIDKNGFPKICDILNTDDFYKEEHRVIYSAALNLHKRHQPIDILSVCQELKDKGNLEIAGGSYAVSKLTNKVASASNIEHHAAIVKQMAMLRQLIFLSQESLKESYSNGANPFEIQSRLIKDLQKLIPVIGADISPAGRMKKTYQFILEAMASKDGVSGIPYPWQSINKHTGGVS